MLAWYKLVLILYSVIILLQLLWLLTTSLWRKYLNVYVTNKYIVYVTNKYIAILIFKCYMVLYYIAYVETIIKDSKNESLEQKQERDMVCSLSFYWFFFNTVIWTSEKKETEKREKGEERVHKLLLTKRISLCCNMLPSIFSLTAKPTNNLLDSPPHP